MGDGRPVAPRRDRDPEVIGDWRIAGRVGAGGMGVVYLARRDDGTVGALKVIADHLLDSPGFRERFEREITILLRVEGTGVARVLDADASGEHPFVVTEYVDAATLQEWVDAHGPVPQPMWRGLASGLLGALDAIHAIGVLHRDIKPSNVLLAPHGPVLIDFGVAAVVDTTAITAPQMLVGTPEWLAPERLSGSPASPASDVFSLGGLLAYAGTGRAPFAAASPAESMRRVTSGQADLTGLAPDQVDLVSAMLAPDPAQRPAPAQALQWLARLTAATAATTELAQGATRVEAEPPEATHVEPSPPGASPAEPPRSRRRPAAVVALVLIISGLAIAGAAYLLTHNDSNDQAASPTPSQSSDATPSAGDFTTECTWTEREALEGAANNLASVIAQCDGGASISAQLGLQTNSTGLGIAGYELSGSIGGRPLALSSQDGQRWEGALGGVRVVLNVGRTSDLAVVVLQGSTVGSGSVRCSGPEPSKNSRATGAYLIWDNPSTVTGTYGGDVRITRAEVGALCSLAVVGVPASGLGDFAQ